jgi:hypothetical protein
MTSIFPETIFSIRQASAQFFELLMVAGREEEEFGVLELKSESQATRKMYGLDNAVTREFGTQCLIGRRLAEAGVRFIELSHGDWDHHANIYGKDGNFDQVSPIWEVNGSSHIHFVRLIWRSHIWYACIETY